MRSVRVLALPCLVGVLLSTAIGPGLSLVRCNLTGHVSIDCCCASPEAARPDALGDEPSGCCTITHLSAPWNSIQVATPGVQPAAVTVVALLGLDRSPWAGSAFLRPTAPIFATPRRWLDAARI
ncbi:MAG: hypothetical protein ACYDCL_15465 [Myxococcales bacterium]